jgi:hypothetical protein
MPDHAVPKAERRAPPRSVLLAGLLAALVHSLPFLRTRLSPSAGDGMDWLPIGYIPKDWLAYVALIR